VPQYKSDSCTSDKFQSAIGVHICLNFNRPETNDWLQILKAAGTREYQFEDEDDFFDPTFHDVRDRNFDGKPDYRPDEHVFKRPNVILSGPFHFNLAVKNIELVDQIVLEFTNVSSSDSNAQKTVVKTVKGGSEQERLVALFTGMEYLN
jgi:hypothetical protein